MRALVIAALAVVLAGAFAATVVAAPRDTALVSRASGAAGVKGNGNSHLGRVSADGRHVAFASESNNLAPGTSGGDQVYVRDLQTLVTSVVSRADGALGEPGNDQSHEPAISGDGRFVAFRSSASNLVSADTDTGSDVYVRDLQLGTTTLVSRADGLGGPKADLGAFRPAISADGRYVAFLSSATNLEGSSPSEIRTYVRDVRTGATILASRADGASGAPASSGDPTISGNGRYVVFSSAAALSADDVDTDADIFIRDLEQRTTSLVTKPLAGGPYTVGQSRDAAVSADGRYVGVLWVGGPAFSSPSFAYRQDLLTGATALASAADGVDPPSSPSVGNSVIGGGDVALSPDGRFVVFTTSDFLTNDGDRDLTDDVFVRDMEGATTTLVSRASGATGAKGNDASFAATISAGGRVAFTSLAFNLVPDDPSRNWDVYTHDYVPPAPTSQAPGAQPVTGDQIGPVVSDLRVRVQRRRGALRRIFISYRLSEAAHVRFALDAMRAGHRRGGRCRPGGAGRRCMRAKRLPGELTDQGAVGFNQVRVGKRWCRIARLSAGRYRLLARAMDAAGNRSRARRTAFTIARKR